MNRTSRSTDADDDLIDALENVAAQLGLIRQVLDEIFTELQWANQNPRDADDSARAIRRITSMPLDPTAPDWADRLNRFTPADVPVPKENASMQIPGAQSADAKPGKLF